MTTDRKRPITLSLRDTIRDEMTAQADARGLTLSGYLEELVTADAARKARAGVRSAKEKKP